MAKPCGGWYHVIGGTYGSWLRGDGRGWRARHHREHVDGDYRTPPPMGRYESLYQVSLTLMKRGKVVLSPVARQVAAEAMIEKLPVYGTEVARLCVGGCHFHVLMRIQSPRMAMRGLCPDNALRDGRNPLPRHVIGAAKKHASHTLRERNLKQPGTLWAKRPHVIPVESQAHFEWVRDQYIPKHFECGAVVLPSA